MLEGEDRCSFPSLLSTRCLKVQQCMVCAQTSPGLQVDSLHYMRPSQGSERLDEATAMLTDSRREKVRHPTSFEKRAWHRNESLLTAFQDCQEKDGNVLTTRPSLECLLTVNDGEVDHLFFGVRLLKIRSRISSGRLCQSTLSSIAAGV